MVGLNRTAPGALSEPEHPAMGGDEDDIMIDTPWQRRNNELALSRDRYASSPYPVPDIL